MPGHGRTAELATTVSIRTRHRCRVMPAITSRSYLAVCCFNPHPASLPGDAIAASLSRVRCGGFNPHPASLPGDAALAYVDVLPFVVSIRTRHRCRVMPFWVVPAQLTPKVSIRTRHRCRVMPCTVTYWSILSRVSIRTRHRCRVMRDTIWYCLPVYGFQSAPGIAAG